MNIWFIISMLIGGVVGIFLFRLIECLVNDIRNGRRDNILVYFLYFKLKWFRLFFNKRLCEFRRTHKDWRIAELGMR